MVGEGSGIVREDSGIAVEGSGIIGENKWRKESGGKRE